MIDKRILLEAVALRRDFHRHPELRFEETRTASVLAREMRAAGFDVQDRIGVTGLAATLRGSRDHPHVLVRADMDALPIPDLKDVSYQSTNSGVSHACGHDVHMAVSMAVARLLARENEIAGRVTFLFQPAEEIPFGEKSGAQSMLDAGVLDDYPGDAIVGLHCWPTLPVGTIGVDNRIAMAAKDAFKISLRGVSSHAALPRQGRDAVLALCQVVVALHLLLRRLDADDQTILNVGTIKGGRSQSVIADEAEATGTIRTVDEQLRSRLKEEIDRHIEGMCIAFGVAHDIEWANEMPSVVNDPRLVERILELTSGGIGDGRITRLLRPPMTADDFALFAQRVPGLYLKLGICGGRTCPPLHSSWFDVDERAIAYGAAAIHRLVMSLIQRSLQDGFGVPA